MKKRLASAEEQKAFIEGQLVKENKNLAVCKSERSDLARENKSLKERVRLAEGFMQEEPEPEDGARTRWPTPDTPPQAILTVR